MPPNVHGDYTVEPGETVEMTVRDTPRDALRDALIFGTGCFRVSYKRRPFIQLFTVKRDDS